MLTKTVASPNADVAFVSSRVSAVPYLTYITIPIAGSADEGLKQHNQGGWQASVKDHSTDVVKIYK